MNFPSVILASALVTAGFFVSQTNQSTLYVRPAKLIYDRIEVEQPLKFVLEGRPCETAGLIRFEGKCYTPKNLKLVKK